MDQPQRGQKRKGQQMTKAREDHLYHASIQAIRRFPQHLALLRETDFITYRYQCAVLAERTRTDNTLELEVAFFCPIQPSAGELSLDWCPHNQQWQGGPYLNWHLYTQNALKQQQWLWFCLAQTRNNSVASFLLRSGGNNGPLALIWDFL
jgi:hypothetical protein